MCVCVCGYVRMYVCMYVCMYVVVVGGLQLMFGGCLDVCLVDGLVMFC